MESSRKGLIAAAVTTAFLSAGVSWAADPPKAEQPAPEAKVSSADATKQAAEAKDFGKISADGSAAFQDLTFTRLAIFAGQVDAAKKYVEKADAAFEKARTDATVFTKAEADFKMPASKGAATGGAAAADAGTADRLKTPIAWLPVDGQLAIEEDFTASPKKSEALADANKSLRHGERTAALEKLKLAGVNIEVALAVVPLEQTIKSVHEATTLIADGKYYEASQVLRQVEDNERFDDITISGVPFSRRVSGAAAPK